jgi:transcriptional regulator with XRE-family HTH domain
MAEFPRYLQALKDRYCLTSDYALARKLGIAQPEVNLIRRGLKVPKPELCIKIANLLEKNPVELLLVAQKDKAPSKAKEYWTLALTAVDVMLHVPKRPRYLPRKVEEIGQELRQFESQTLTYEAASANAEAVRLMEMTEHSVDAIMERWNIWKKGEALYPNYLLANQAAAKRGVNIRRLLVLSRTQMEDPSLVADAVEVMDDQRRAGIKIYYAFREALARSPTFQRLEEDFRKHGAAEDINAAMFDGEILIFSRAYGEVPLGMVGKPTPITMINRLQIVWKPEMIRDLNPAPLFDMTRHVCEYRGAKPFKDELSGFLENNRKEAAS